MGVTFQRYSLHNIDIYAITGYISNITTRIGLINGFIILTVYSPHMRNKTKYIRLVGWYVARSVRAESYTSKLLPEPLFGILPVAV